MPERGTLLWWLMNWLGWRVEPRRKKRKKKKKRSSGNQVRKALLIDGNPPRAKPRGVEAFCRSVAAVKDDPWPARVRDISAGSIGLHLTRRFEPGTLLVIELEKKEMALTHTLVARVVNAIPSQTGTGWMVGCTLANKIAEDDLQALLL
jgi:PilZ domain-containing protein